MNLIRKTFKCACLAAGLACAASAAGTRWTVERAQAWAAARPWCCGVNYIPSNAINYTEMWDKTSFSPELIRRELALMKGLGLNCARVFLQYLVYEDDPEYCVRTFRRFLELCDEAGVKAMPCLFDDCTFGAVVNPRLGKQDEPLIGWYSWDWTPSPGRRMVVDPRQHGKLEKYVKGMVGAFKDDERILAWDLYNEPSLGKHSLALLQKTFAWAREVPLTQPITTGIWNQSLKEQNEFLLANCDIITFHCYQSASETEKFTHRMRASGRPVICTEWMNRCVKSTVKDCLPVFERTRTGCMLWGLVWGKSQTHLPWGWRPEKGPYKGVWQCNLFRVDHTPYDPAEIALLSEAVRRANP